MQAGTVVTTPRGIGVVIGSAPGGKIVVMLDLEVERFEIERPDDVITVWAFDPKDVKGVE